MADSVDANDRQKLLAYAAAVNRLNSAVIAGCYRSNDDDKPLEPMDEQMGDIPALTSMVVVDAEHISFVAGDQSVKARLVKQRGLWRVEYLAADHIADQTSQANDIASNAAAKKYASAQAIDRALEP